MPSKKVGLNLGPKTTAEMAAIGITTLAQLKKEGWENVFRRLVAEYPDRLNLNMASALIGATLGRDWRNIPPAKKQRARELIKELKPKKQRSAKKANNITDPSFVQFVVDDQLSELVVTAPKMFGGYGLYFNGKFFGIISGSALYFKTSDRTRERYLAAGSKPFKPTATQTLKNYYEVPAAILEDKHALLVWAREAIAELIGA